MGTQLTAEQIIRIHDLRTHPEGGYFRETYRSEEFIPGDCLPKRYAADRRFCTAIYYLLPAGSLSRLHRLASDEVWHFYSGGPLTIVELRPDGSSDRIVLGPEVDRGHRPQHVVKAGAWFGAYPNPGTDYAFVGCTVAPGFEFEDFQMADRQEVLRHYPQEAEIIRKLTQ